MAAASAEHRLAAASAAGSGPERRQHSPSPCMSKAALTGLCGSQRGEGTGSPPAASAVDVASLLRASADSQGAEPGEQQQQEQGSRLSSPVANLLRESARLISSVDLGPGGGGGGGFGSAIIPAAAASSGSHASSARNTAATPDGAVQSAETEADDACSTPRSGAVSQRPQSPAGQAAGAAASQAWQQRYMAATTFEEMVAAVSLAAPAAEQPEASGAVAGRSLSQVRCGSCCWMAIVWLPPPVSNSQSYSYVAHTIPTCAPPCPAAAAPAQLAAALAHLHPAQLPGPTEQPQQPVQQRRWWLHPWLLPAFPRLTVASQQLPSGPSGPCGPGCCRGGGGGCSLSWQGGGSRHGRSRPRWRCDGGVRAGRLLTPPPRRHAWGRG